MIIGGDVNLSGNRADNVYFMTVANVESDTGSLVSVACCNNSSW